MGDRLVHPKNKDDQLAARCAASKVRLDVDALTGGNIVINVGGKVILIWTLLIHQFTSGLHVFRQPNRELLRVGLINSSSAKCFKFLATGLFVD
jgi:hypothetical protein